jgi:flagellar hook-associated protein 2
MSSISPPSSQPVYQASGLSSGLDTQGIIDKLVTVESLPLKTIQTQEAGITVKLSTVGAISAAMSSLQGIASNLGSSGVNAVAAVGTYSDFTVTGAPTTAADYDVKVSSLAHAAKARSTTTYADGNAIVSATAQTLKLSVDGQEYDIDVKANTKLSDLVTQINTSGSAHKPDGTAVTLPFSASMVSDGTSSYLTITNNNPGFVVGQPASSALQVTQDIGLGLQTPANLQATNAVVTVDGLTISRRTNQLTDVIPGVTLGLKNNSNTDTDLSFQPDSSSAASRIQGFVNAYNKVQALVASQMDTDTSQPAADGTTSNPYALLGSNFALNIQYKMQSFVSKQVNATGAIRSLHDLGVSLQKDGTLSLDASALNKALATDPNAVNNVFATKTTGLGDSIKTWVNAQTDPFTGALTAQTTGLNATNKQLQTQTDALNEHITAYRAQLNIQFSALESIMSGINTTAQFLDQQAANNNKK